MGKSSFGQVTAKDDAEPGSVRYQAMLSKERRLHDFLFFDGSYATVTNQSQNQETTFSRTASFGRRKIPAWNYLYIAFLVLLDSLMMVVSIGAIYVLRPNIYEYIARSRFPVSGVTDFILLASFAWIVSLTLCHAYTRHIMGEGYELYSIIIGAGFFDFILLCCVSYLLKLDLPRTLILVSPMLATALTIPERWLMRRALHSFRSKGRCTYKAVLVGSSDGINDLIQQLKRSKGIGYLPIAVCPLNYLSTDSMNESIERSRFTNFLPRDPDDARLRVLPFDSHLPEQAKKIHADTIIVADLLTPDSEALRTLSLATESMGLEFSLKATVADIAGASLHLRQDPDMPILTAKLPQYTVLSKFIKRIFDIVFSLFAILLTLPLMVVIAILIKREDGGKILFLQKRVGIYGRVFTIFKFRSMRPDADMMKAHLSKQYDMDSRFIFKLKDDPRVTKIGKFIRKKSLDELPQFFNVLIGSMSLVGPRPALPEDVEKYNDLYSARLLVRPGITGPWQISGRSDLTKEQSEIADISYIQNWSVTGDLAILLKTVFVVIKGEGSY